MVDIQFLPTGTTVNGVVTDPDNVNIRANVATTVSVSAWVSPYTLSNNVPIGPPTLAANGDVYTPITPAAGLGLMRTTVDGQQAATALNVSTFACSKICTAGDDRLWGTVPGAKTVVAFDPVSGVTTTYGPLAITNNFAADSPIIVNAAGNLCALDGALTRAVVWTTAGALVGEYVLTAGAVRTYNSALGADGRVWFTRTNSLTALDTAGVSTDYVFNYMTTLEVFAASNSCLYVKDNEGFAKVDVTGTVIKRYQTLPVPKPVPPAAFVPQVNAVELDGRIYMTDYYGRLYSIDLSTDEIRYHQAPSTTQPGSFATFDGETLIFIDTSKQDSSKQLFRLNPGGALSTTLTVEGEKVAQNNPLPVYINAPPKATYIATNPQYTIPATPTDMVVIGGSNTKTVKIRKIRLFLQQTTGGNNQYFLIKRSTADSGGTPNAVTWVPCDSRNPAPTASFNYYTVNPAGLGAAVGNIVIARLVCATATANSVPAWYDLYDEDKSGQPITLRSAQEQLAINFAGVALPAGMKVQAEVHITEE